MEAIANLGQWTLQWGLQCPFRHAAAYWKGPYSWRHECPCGDDGNPGRNGVGDAPHGAGSAQGRLPLTAAAATDWQTGWDGLVQRA